jgi:hypothetical protein
MARNPCLLAAKVKIPKYRDYELQIMCSNTSPICLKMKMKISKKSLRRKPILPELAAFMLQIYEFFI